MTRQPAGAARRRVDGAVLVTGNENKVLEAERICGFPIRHVEADLPEIQSASLAEVTREKAAEAWHRLERPVIVEETGLELASMNGFPGPLVKWMLEAIGPVGIARTAAGLEDARARAVCIVAYHDGAEYFAGEGRTDGELVLPPRGEHGFGWDSVFRPEGEERTYAELGDQKKDEVGHRGRAWRALLERLG
ncbi:MAG: non-canonical purine NTP pyrophosphatase [Thermoanaerobaculia bacterium]